MGAVSISIFKAYGARTNRQWVNTYEAVERANPTVGDVNPADFTALADALVTAERALHSDKVFFHRYTISTWSPDSTPYDPGALFTQPLAVVGNRAMTPETETVDLRAVLLMQRNIGTGRPGRLMYRGCISEGDMEFSAGYARLVAASIVSDTGSSTGTFRTALTNYVASGTAPVVLALIGGTLVKTLVTRPESGLNTQRVRRRYVAPYHVRMVTGWTVTGVSFKQQGNPYFDRAA